jgi:tetratricopeptide (TPR) repeat protein
MESLLNEPISADPRLQKLERQIGNDPAEAVHQLRLLIADEPLNVDAYRVLAKAIAEQQSHSGPKPTITAVVQGMDYALMQVSRALDSDDLETAEVILRERLIQRPTDVFALVLMARFAKALGYSRESRQLLALAIEFEPQSIQARMDFAAELHRQNQPLEALVQLDRLLEIDPGNSRALTMKASVLGRGTGRYTESIALYEELLARSPRDAVLWTNYGHVLKTVGRFDEGQQAIRKAVELSPTSGVSWWNLSELKVARFSVEDLRIMEGSLNDPEASIEDRYHLHFALGKAIEDGGDYELAFRHYEQANQLRKQSLDYDPEVITEDVDAIIDLFSEQFLRDRDRWGCPSLDPIFVVGITRAGSTLIEQILASHSEIEGTRELPDAAAIARQAGRGESDFLDRLAKFKPDVFRSMGEQYLSQTRVHRVKHTPFFVDKMPTNWLVTPLIHLMLPNAKIIDARRHPMACGFSNFKQHYAFGQDFSYDLEWFARYYRDYVRLMRHIDEVLPGRVHRVVHEQLVLDPETEVRKLLDYVGVPFDEACLRFYENDRAVHTPSAQQVRRPLNPAAPQQWRNFEPWLEPLRKALGPVAELYPAVPDLS